MLCPTGEAAAHYERMAAFRKGFDPSGGAILACVDVGTKAYWWDYGRLGLYFENNLLLTEPSANARALRTFLGLEPSRSQANALGAATTADASSVVLGCSVGSGRIGKGCVLVNVAAPSLDVEDCILVNVRPCHPTRSLARGTQPRTRCIALCILHRGPAPRPLDCPRPCAQVTSTTPIVGRNGLLYNVVHADTADRLDCSAVRADVFYEGTHLKMHSSRDTDGGKAWKTTLEGNELSFEGVYKANQPLDVGECTRMASAAHTAARAKIPAA